MVDNDASAHEDDLVTVLAETLGVEARVAELTAVAKKAAAAPR